MNVATLHAVARDKKKLLTKYYGKSWEFSGGSNGREATYKRQSMSATRTEHAMTRTPSAFVQALVVLLLMVTNCWAQQRPDPNSPRFKGLVQLRNLLQSTGDESLQEFVDTSVSKEFLEKHGRAKLLQMIKRTRAAYADATFTGARPVDKLSAELLFDGVADDVPASIGFSVEQDAPHRFTSIDWIAGANSTGSRDSDFDMATSLEEFMQQLIERDQFSGTVLLAKGEETIFERAYGMASKRFNVPNNLDTKINLGSMNKMFTGVAICQLVEQGKLSFEDNVGKHVPNYPNKDVTDKVTIHHLLTHTSGMGSYWNDKYEAKWKTIRTVEDLVPTFSDDPLSFEPGDRFQYSNAGPVVLGLIIEHVTGMSYYDYVRENIFEPAGMENTDCYEMDRPVPNLAIGYTRANYDGTGDDGPRRNNLFMHSVKGGPAGGGFSTVRDLLRFSMALQQDKLLKPETKQIMLDGKVRMGPDMHYAYLFGQHGKGALRNHGHNGGAPGISADFRFYPELGYTFAVLSNYDNAAMTVSQTIEKLIQQQAAVDHPEVAASLPKYRIGLAFGRRNNSVMIREAIAGGPADQAGLSTGDKIKSINGHKLTEDWLDLVTEPLAKGTSISFEIVRDDKTLVIEVTPELIK